MIWRIGTMGFSYADWAGPFYPPDVRSADYLAYFAAHFDCVELDTTFYAAPDPARVARWAAAVDADFRFCPKTPRDITHQGLLRANLPAMHRFLDALRAAGGKLGVVLLQFPPSMSASRFDDLRAFLAGLPRDIGFAAEFRHDSWWTGSTESLLRDHNVAMVAADYVGSPRAIRVTADFHYVRLIGEHDRYQEMTHERYDPTPQLRWWIDRLSELGKGIATAWVMHNNDYAGFSIATARRMQSMLGRPLLRYEPPVPRRRQATLFD